MSIVVALLIAVGVFLMWAVSATASPRHFVLHLCVAGLGSLCIGITGGLFYALLDSPVIWP